MSHPLSTLTFSLLDDDVIQRLDQLSTEAVELNYPLLSPEGPSLESRILDYLKDFNLVSELVQGIQARQGISKRDVLALESLRVKYTPLDKLMTENPIAMYTTESSRVLLDESLESFLGAAVDSVTRWLNSFLKWIWELISKGVDTLSKTWVDNKRTEAKFEAIDALRGYLTSVGRSLSTFPEGVAAVKRIRNERLQDFNRDVRDNEIAYLKDSAQYDAIVESLGLFLSNQLGSLLVDSHGFLRAVSKATTLDEMIEIDLIYRTALENRHNAFPVFTVLKSLERTAAVLKVKTDIKPTVPGLIAVLQLLPVTSANNAKGQLHPHFFDELMTKGVVFTPYSATVKDFVEKELVGMLKRSREILSQPLAFTSILVQQNGDIAKLVGLYRDTLLAYQTLTQQLNNILLVRTTALDKVAKSLLTEVKTLDKWISSTQNLPVEVLGVRGHHQKQVAKSVTNARL